MEIIDDLVSIIMPSFNSEKYISDSIDSVLDQTYNNFELIIIDDSSSDNTGSIIAKYAMAESRIKVIFLNDNFGAGNARNLGLKQAKGEFIAFIDSDDLWDEHKLSKQIDFMRNTNSAISCTNYFVIKESNSNLISERKFKGKIYYKDLIKKGIGNSTVIYNTKLIGKTYIEPIRKRNDYLMWLTIIKKVEYISCLQESLSYYRVRKSSLSSNKFNLISFNWNIYRNIEKIGFIKSLYLIAINILRVLLNIILRK